MRPAQDQFLMFAPLGWLLTSLMNCQAFSQVKGHFSPPDRIYAKTTVLLARGLSVWGTGSRGRVLWWMDSPVVPESAEGRRSLEIDSMGPRVPLCFKHLVAHRWFYGQWRRVDLLKEIYWSLTFLKLSWLSWKEMRIFCRWWAGTEANNN